MKGSVLAPIIWLITAVAATTAAEWGKEREAELLRFPMSEFIVIDDYCLLTNAVRVFIAKASEYRRIDFVMTAQQALSNNPSPGRPLKGYTRGDGQLDLNTEAGRLRWITKQVLDQVDGQAEGSMDERIKRWMAYAMKRNLKTKQEIADLKRHYQGRIKLGRFESWKELAKTEEVLDQFMCEWFPYGKPVEELENILGIACARKGDRAVMEWINPDGDLHSLALIIKDEVIIRIEGAM